MQPLSSSNLAGCEYDPDTRVLRIRFKSGRTYNYANVPQDVYEGLLSAPSPGQYFNSAIKGVYAEQ